jgi:fatty acid desaturase
MSPVTRFLYWNMNFHVEHHMFPMVPYHALPSLHHEVRDQLPVPYPSLFAAYREILPTLLRQMRDPTYFVRRVLPADAAPFRPEMHEAVFERS